MGRLYISYAEQVGPLHASELPTCSCSTKGRNRREMRIWPRSEAAGGSITRNKIANTLNGFFDFFFDGISMIGLTGIQGGAAQGYSLADFRRFLTPDWGDAVIETVYQSHFEDAGKPDIPKVWLEVVIDLETSSTGGAIYVAFNNGVGPDVPDQDEPPNFHSPALWQIGGYGTQQRAAISYALPGGGIEAKNISVALLADSAGPVTIHNVYLYYYEEARAAILASSLPTDLGVGKVKQCKELSSISTRPGDVQVTLAGDLPGNALQTRQLPIVAQRGRAVFKYPFPVTEGFLWKLIFYGPSYFRLYSARLLMRVLRGIRRGLRIGGRFPVGLDAAGSGRSGRQDVRPAPLRDGRGRPSERDDAGGYPQDRHTPCAGHSDNRGHFAGVGDGSPPAERSGESESHRRTRCSTAGHRAIRLPAL